MHQMSAWIRRGARYPALLRFGAEPEVVYFTKTGTRVGSKFEEIFNFMVSTSLKFEIFFGVRIWI